MRFACRIPLFFLYHISLLRPSKIGGIPEEDSPGVGGDFPEIDAGEETGQETALTRRALIVVADS